MGDEEKQREHAPFDKILEIVGNDGRYQKRFNILFGYCLLVAVMMPTLNIIMALAVPDHWCHVHGRENTNFTGDEWKEITIPKENNSRGVYTFSSCKMYDTFSKTNIVDCQFGWEYDRTWYTNTAVSQEDWVCSRELHVTNTLVFTKIGDFLGTFIFGQVADLIGRRPAFFITIAFLFIGRFMSVFTSGYIWIFAFAALLGNLATPSVYQSPLTIALEISKAEDRASAQLAQSLGSTTGMCLLPIVFWMCGDWIPFMLITSIPCGLAELPAGLMGRYFCDKMGRRWSHRYGFVAVALCSISMIFMINNDDLALISSAVAVFLKLFITFAFYAINLHMMETFPTCVRQTGNAFCVIMASAVGTVSPYIIYLGTSVNLKYPYMILAVLAIFGVICGLFLSETLNKRLPETLEDAKEQREHNNVSKY